MPKLFVSNLPINCTTKEIRELFSAFGPLKSIQPYITEKKENNQIQSVFVEYVNEDDANTAIEKLKDRKIYEKNIEIKKAFERNHKIYVGKLVDSIKSEDLIAHFSAYGEIQSIQREKENDFAFLIFKDQSVADLLIKSHGKQKICGFPVEVKKAFSKTENQQKTIPPARTITIKNLAIGTIESDLINFFRDCGVVERTQIGDRRAIVVFHNELSALKAIKYKNRKLLKTKKVQLEMYSSRKKISQ